MYYFKQISAGRQGIALIRFFGLDCLNYHIRLDAEIVNILTGVSNLSEAYPDEETKKVVDRSRNWLLGSFSLSAGLKLIVDIFNIQDGTPKTIMAIVAVLAEIISYVIYLIALNKSKKMLAK